MLDSRAMHMTVRQVIGECAALVQRPARLRKLLDADRRRDWLIDRKRRQIKADWAQETDAFTRRQYKTYEEYIAHQKSKLPLIRNSEWMRQYDVEFADALKQRLRAGGIVQAGMNVVCLAARIGSEVRAFRDIGCFAVGLDLNPGTENKFVLYGDFHNIQFATASTDIVFTNSLDHALEPSKVLAEVRRILKPSGVLIIEAQGGTEDDHPEPPEEWESFYWTTVNKLVEMIEGESFGLISRSLYSRPGAGDHMCFRVRPGATEKRIPDQATQNN